MKRIIALAPAFSLGVATAQTVTYDFTGTLDVVPAGLQSTLSVGDQFSGTVTLNESAIDENSNTSIGLYSDIGSATLELAGSSFTISNLDLLIRDNFGTPPDLYSLGGIDNGNLQVNGPEIEGVSLDRVELLVGDSTDLDLITGDAFQSIELDKSDPDRRQLVLLFDSGLQAYGTLSAYSESAERVAIDIKPGSDPNCFNLDGHGVIPVAILGSEEFDVASIDTHTLLFDGLDVRVRGNKDPQCSFEYSNEDAFLDMVCQFEDDSSNWLAGDSDAGTLTGKLTDGTAFQGTDEICIVP